MDKLHAYRPEEESKMPPFDMSKYRRDEEGYLFEFEQTEAVRERLAELREFSTRTNKALQERLDAENLPFYSWNKSSSAHEHKTFPYPKVMRLAIMIRPEFYKSLEEKSEKNRYTTSPDQCTIFIHVTPEDEVQKMRLHVGSKYGYLANFGASFFPNVEEPHYEDEKLQAEKVHLERLIKDKDADGLADYAIERLKMPTDTGQKHCTDAQYATAFYQEAYAISSVDAAQAFFSHADSAAELRIQSQAVFQNLVKVVVTSVLDKVMQSDLHIINFLDPENRSAEAAKILAHEAERLLQLEVPVYKVPRSGTVAGAIPNAQEFVDTTIRNLVKFYKPQLLGWNKQAGKKMA